MAYAISRGATLLAMTYKYVQVATCMACKRPGRGHSIYLYSTVQYCKKVGPRASQSLLVQSFPTANIPVDPSILSDPIAPVGVACDDTRALLMFFFFFLTIPGTGTSTRVFTLRVASHLFLRYGYC